MKKNKKPTTSQLSYMVTGLLSAMIQKHGNITKTNVEEAIETAKFAYDLIIEAVGDPEKDEEDDNQRKKQEEMPNYFADFPWKEGKATWTDLDRFLRTKGVTSNRRISKIFNESLEKGYLRRDENTHKYLPPLP